MGDSDAAIRFPCQSEDIADSSTLRQLSHLLSVTAMLVLGMAMTFGDASRARKSLMQVIHSHSSGRDDAPLDMKVAGIEPGCLSQLVDIENGQHPAADLDQPLLAQALEGPVGVDGG